SPTIPRSLANKLSNRKNPRRTNPRRTNPRTRRPRRPPTSRLPRRPTALAPPPRPARRRRRSPTDDDRGARPRPQGLGGATGVHRDLQPVTRRQQRSHVLAPEVAVGPHQR